MSNKSHQKPSEGMVVIIDDSADNLRVLTGMLKKQGYKVHPARDGESGMKLVRSKDPDLVLLDIVMPGLDGYEICRQLQADPLTSAIPIIFVSGLNEMSDKLKGFTLGGADYITKPFQDAEVLARVRAHVMNSRLQRALHEENARYHALEEASFEGILLHAGGQILDVNDALTSLFRSSRDALLNQPVQSLFSPALRDCVTRHIEQGEMLPAELEGIKEDGRIFPMHVHTKTITYQGRSVNVMTMLDLSSQYQLEQENRTLKDTLPDRYRFGTLVGKSPAMQQVYEQITNAAASRFSVLISGESGTGKELAARMIHQLSSRKEKPFIVVNCGAVQAGLFEREFFGHRKGAFTGAVGDGRGYLDTAHTGTLFLDEVAELTPEQQVKLLRVLQTGEYIPVGETTPKIADVRILAATNQDIHALRETGKIRDDFFYRINVISIDLPPLRGRKEDLPLLVEHFLASYDTCEGGFCLSAYLMDAIYDYDWPGNVRELEHELQHYLTTKHFKFLMVNDPAYAPLADDHTALNLPQAVKALERRYILNAMQHVQSHRSQAAKLLGISRRTLYQKLKEFGLDEV